MNCFICNRLADSEYRTRERSLCTKCEGIIVISVLYALQKNSTEFKEIYDASINK